MRRIVLMLAFVLTLAPVAAEPQQAVVCQGLRIESRGVPTRAA